MKKKNLLLLLFSVSVLLIVCTGGFFYLNDFNSSSITKTTGKNNVATQESTYIRELRERMPKIEENATVIQVESNLKKGLSMPLSPVLFAQTLGTDNYIAAQDIQSGMFGHIRYETAGISSALKQAEKKSVHNFTVLLPNNSKVTFPELPVTLSASVYYSHSSGIYPLTFVAEWFDLNSKSYSKWADVLTKAGFKSDKITMAGVEEGIVTSIEQFKVSDRIIAEITYTEKTPTGKDNKNTAKEVQTINLYLVSEMESKVKAALDEVNKEISSRLLAMNALKTGDLLWRRPVVVADYRIAESSKVYGIDFLTLNDRTMLNTTTPVYTTGLESWGSIPIGWSWLLYREDWNKIKTEIISETTGLTNVSDADVFAGVRSKDDLFFKCDLVDAGTGRDQMIKVNIVDKKADTLISSTFDYFNSIDVQGLRNQFSLKITNSGEKNEPNTENNMPIAPPSKGA